MVLPSTRPYRHLWAGHVGIPSAGDALLVARRLAEAVQSQLRSSSAERRSPYALRARASTDSQECQDSQIVLLSVLVPIGRAGPTGDFWNYRTLPENTSSMRSFVTKAPEPCPFPAIAE